MNDGEASCRTMRHWFTGTLAQRLAKAKARFGLDREHAALDLTQFRKPLPPRVDGQADLFASG